VAGFRRALPLKPTLCLTSGPEMLDWPRFQLSYSWNHSAGSASRRLSVLADARNRLSPRRISFGVRKREGFGYAKRHNRSTPH
jgi:hypothetical protein